MSWGWKLATSPDDVMNFLNGVGAYQAPVSAARICAMWKGNHPEFYVFYQRHQPPEPAGGWGWKLATDPDDVQHFLCGSGSYAHPIKEAQIAAFWKENHCEFYVFYKNPAPGEPVVANWGWKLAPDPTDAMNFLNGTSGYSHPVTTARITALEHAGQEEFYVFYQRAVEGQPIGNWAWKLATTADDALNFVNGTGDYHRPAKGFEIGSFWTGSYNRFYVFTNQGTRIWLQSPLANERFVQGESVHLRALVTGEQPVDGSALRWSSSLDGLLGNGPHVIVGHLSLGTHTIKVTGYRKRLTRTVRIFTDLGAFYQAPPSPAEIKRIGQDLAFQWADGTGVEEHWSAYPSIFDQHSTDPSKLVIYAKLDVLRHQDFAEPLPFTGGKAIYEYFRSFVHTLNLRLDCSFNTGGGGQMSLNRSLSVWDGRSSGTADNPDACKVPFPNPTLYAYVNPLYLLNHEERHNEPSDPGHVYVGDDQLDPCLENGSGHAWAAMYTMWVYKYGKYDPAAIKDEAKQIAKSLLESRFASTPTHSNPKVQAIVDELMQP
jgi:hypothetical protein